MKRIALTFALSAGMLATSGTADAGLFDCFKKKKSTCQPVCCAPAAPAYEVVSAPVVEAAPVVESCGCESAVVESAPVIESAVYESAPVFESAPVIESAPASDCGCDGTVSEGTVIEGGYSEGNIISEGTVISEGSMSSGEIYGGEVISGGEMVSPTLAPQSTDGLPAGAVIISDQVTGDYNPPAASGQAVEDAPKPPAEDTGNDAGAGDEGGNAVEDSTADQDAGSQGAGGAAAKSEDAQPET